MYAPLKKLTPFLLLFSLFVPTWGAKTEKQEKITITFENVSGISKKEEFSFSEKNIPKDSSIKLVEISLKKNCQTIKKRFNNPIHGDKRFQLFTDKEGKTLFDPKTKLENDTTIYVKFQDDVKFQVGASIIGYVRDAQTEQRVPKKYIFWADTKDALYEKINNAISSNEKVKELLAGDKQLMAKTHIPHVYQAWNEAALKENWTELVVTKKRTIPIQNNVGSVFSRNIDFQLHKETIEEAVDQLVWLGADKYDPDNTKERTIKLESGQNLYIQIDPKNEKYATSGQIFLEQTFEENLQTCTGYWLLIVKYGNKQEEHIRITAKKGAIGTQSTQEIKEKLKMKVDLNDYMLTTYYRGKFDALNVSNLQQYKRAYPYQFQVNLLTQEEAAKHRLKFQSISNLPLTSFKFKFSQKSGKVYPVHIPYAGVTTENWAEVQETIKAQLVARKILSQYDHLFFNKGAGKYYQEDHELITLLNNHIGKQIDVSFGQARVELTYGKGKKLDTFFMIHKSKQLDCTDVLIESRQSLHKNGKKPEELMLIDTAHGKNFEPESYASLPEVLRLRAVSQSEMNNDASINTEVFKSMSEKKTKIVIGDENYQEFTSNVQFGITTFKDVAQELKLEVKGYFEFEEERRIFYMDDYVPRGMTKFDYYEDEELERSFKLYTEEGNDFYNIKVVVLRKGQKDGRIHRKRLRSIILSIYADLKLYDYQIEDGHNIYLYTKDENSKEITYLWTTEDLLQASYNNDRIFFTQGSCLLRHMVNGNVKGYTLLKKEDRLKENQVRDAIIQELVKEEKSTYYLYTNKGTSVEGDFLGTSKRVTLHAVSDKNAIHIKDKNWKNGEKNKVLDNPILLKIEFTISSKTDKEMLFDSEETINYALKDGKKTLGEIAQEKFPDVQNGQLYEKNDKYEVGNCIKPKEVPTAKLNGKIIYYNPLYQLDIEGDENTLLIDEPDSELEAIAAEADAIKDKKGTLFYKQKVTDTLYAYYKAEGLEVKDICEPKGYESHHYTTPALVKLRTIKVTHHDLSTKKQTELKGDFHERNFFTDIAGSFLDTNKNYVSAVTLNTTTIKSIPTEPTKTISDLIKETLIVDADEISMVITTKKRLLTREQKIAGGAVFTAFALGGGGFVGFKKFKKHKVAQEKSKTSKKKKPNAKAKIK